MSVQTIIDMCAVRGLHLTSNGQDLEILGDKGALCDELITLLRANKPELVDYIAAFSGQQVNTITPVSRGGDLPLSSAQQRLWFIDHLNGGSAEYNMPLHLELEGELDITLIERAIGLVIERHEILRTVYLKREEQTVQQILTDFTFNLTVHDLSVTPECEQQAAVEALLHADQLTSFTLSQDLTLRGGLAILQKVAGKPVKAVLFLNMHHIAFDGWSKDILSKEFLLNFEALSRGGEAPLPPLAIQYADYAHWQQTYQVPQVQASQLSYWQQHLKGVAPLHSLPLDYPRPAVKQNAAQRVVRQLSSQVASNLETLARSQQLTPFMLLHSLLALIIARHSNNHDTVIGTPVSSRSMSELEPLIGFFVNTLVLRAHTDYNTLAEYFAAIRQTHLDALANQDVPFEQLVDMLKLPRSTAYNPLLQLMMTINNDFGVETGVEGKDHEIQGLIIRSVESDVLTTKFDIDVQFSFSAQGLEMSWVYDTSLFSEAYITLLGDQLASLITKVSDLEGQLDEVDLASLHVPTEQEQKHLVEVLNTKQVNYEKTHCVHQLFEQQAQQHPDKVAVVYQDNSLTYQQLNQRANQLAHYLKQSYQLQPDQLVGLCIDRSLEMVIGLLGILKAGAGYVPLEPNYPQARIDYILQDTEVPLVLSQHKLNRIFAGFSGAIMALDDVADLDQPHALDAYPCTELSLHDSKVNARNLAYVIYTSGSTGQPKGVMTEHLNVVRLVKDAAVMPFNADTVMLQNANIAFDAATIELWGPLLNGGQVVLYPHAHHAPQYINETVRRHGITAMWLTAGLFREWSHDVAQDTQLEYVMAGGDALDLDSVKRVQQALPELTLINGYGPTENTTFSTCYAFTSPHRLRAVPIGRKLASDEVYVLNSNKQLVAKGAVGELYVGGDGLARGYLNRPELTAQCFIDNPFYNASEPHSAAKLYKTGDLVRYLANDTLEFIGRVDSQVKIRGFRVELGEIEAQLNNLTMVDSSTVLMHNEQGNQQLVAYVKPHSEVSESAKAQYLGELVNQLSKQVPGYMVPAAVVLMTHWPLTANGKVDKKALPAPSTEVLTDSTEYIAPQTDMEQQLVDIWAELLNRSSADISATADFFDLGGHSLLTIRLVAEIRKQCGIEVSVQTIFEHTKLNLLAQYLTSSAIASARPDIKAVPRDAELYEVSFAQRRLWFIDQFQGSSAEYNMPMAMRIRGQFDLQAAEQALHHIVARHEVLRTVYVAHEGDVKQQIRPMSAVSFKLHIEQVPAGYSEQALADQVTALMAAPFDLANDCMLRASYLKTATEEGILVLNIHHIASDGWSMELLQSEFSSLYQAYREGRNVPVAELSIQYVDYAQWQREYLSGEVLETQLDYWASQLSELPELHSLPMTQERPTTKQHVGASMTGQLPAEIAQKLLALSKAHQVTPFMLLHGALALLLSRHSNSSDIVVGTPVANRQQSELTPLMGFFANTLVLRAQTDHASLSDYFAHIKQVHIQAQQHQDVPFEQLVERLNVSRSAAYSPLFQIMLTTSTDFALNPDDKIATVLPGVEIAPLSVDYVQSKFDLTIDLSLTEQGLAINWIYDIALFDAQLISRLNAHLCRLLESLTELPSSQAPGTLTMQSEAEIAHLAFELNDTEQDYDKALCVHTLFEQQVASHPAHVAVSFEDHSLTYQQLNEKANQLAHYLVQQHAVGPDTLVGLCVERSIEMVVGILGILKAGGAYVPLDPSYPQQRIDYMLEDAALEIVLCHRPTTSLLGDFHGQALQIDELGELLPSTQNFALYSKENMPLRSNDARHLAYVIYTSGSTGKPKGVMVEHQALHNRIRWMNNKYGLSCEDKILQKTPFSFDVSVWEFIWTLAYGAQLVVARPEGHKEPGYLTRVIQQQGITKLHFVPSMLGLILEHEDFRHCQSLQQVFCSGEALQQSHVRGFRAALPECQLHNLYGPTEAAIDVSFWDCSSDISAGVPIGKPIDNIQLLILDKDANIVPKGVTGELHIGGDGLARGYLNKPELTAERFIANPYFDATRHGSSEILYKTGDLARLRHDGEIEYQGRTDHQVKIRGLRVELGEIEHCLSGLDGVDSALVMASECAGSLQLIGYIKPAQPIAQAQQEAFINVVKQSLRKSLSHQVLPNIFMLVEDWPLTPNGKVSRRELPAVDVLASQSNYVAPRTHTEQVLAQIWAELLTLDAEGISVTSSFFDLGGHSIMAVRLIDQVQQRLAQTVSLVNIFANPVLADLASYLSSESDNDAPEMLVEMNEVKAQQDTLYCIPGMLATAYDFAELSDELTTFNVKAFNHQGNLDSNTPFASLAENVQAIAEAIVRDSAAPYRVAGHSFGGALAFAVTQALQAQGHTVKLILLDSYMENLATEISPDELAQQPKYAALAASQKQQLIALYEAQSASYNAFELSEMHAETLCLVAEDSGTLVARYQQQYLNYFKQDLTVQLVPGDHHSMLTGDNVVTTAASITQFLKNK
ncbi:non-ribosomal peptide synthetase [Pseudoalteromonas rubra]|uniref:non-ribosomal peptide synthetase n=1 Tax=Pseudoalteromonas rubra TaxID=43658 RepID=UPI000F78E862|nr:non-ribosomal peptide synthetase [Pseudoalteromonas rubra]